VLQMTSCVLFRNGRIRRITSFMAISSKTKILGVGSYSPTRRLSNDELSKIVETSDDWISSRTGIRERRIASEAEATSDLSLIAAKRALEDAQISPEDIDLVLVATITPDMAFPSTACILQHKLGLRKVACFDLEAACSGFLYALDVADAMLSTGRYKNVLVVGAEKMSSIMDWEDRTTCVLFGDGAGAAVLSKEGTGSELLGFYCGADGATPSLLYQPAGGSARPASSETLETRQHYLKMNGREIFKSAVRVMESSCRHLLDKHNLKITQIDHVIPHQANMRIVESLSKRLEIPMDNFYCNLDRYGNTSAASIPLALDEAVKADKFKKGQLGLLVAFGAGLTWASSLIRF